MWDEQWNHRAHKSHYVIKGRNGYLDFILSFTIFVWNRELCALALCSFKDWATTNLLISKFRQFVSLCEGRMLPALLLDDWNQKVCHSFNQQLMLWWLGNVADYLKVKLHNNSSRNRSDECILGTIIMRLLSTPLWQEIQILGTILCTNTSQTNMQFKSWLLCCNLFSSVTSSGSSTTKFLPCQTAFRKK